MSDYISISTGCDDRLVYAQSLVAFLSSAIAGHETLELEIEATFGLSNIVAQLDTLLTDEIKERYPSRQALKLEQSPPA